MEKKITNVQWSLEILNVNKIINYNLGGNN